MSEKRIAVIPPISQPFSFPFPPATNPPMNKAKIDKPRMSHVIEDSVRLVNFKSKENMRLVTRAITKMVIRPNRIAFPHFFVSTKLPPFNLYKFNSSLFMLVFITEYSWKKKIDYKYFSGLASYDGNGDLLFNSQKNAMKDLTDRS